MNLLTFILVFLAAWFVLKAIGGLTGLKPAEAARQIDAGEAVLIDVREPSEWSGGVAAPALLLSLGDLRGSRTHWKSALEAHRGKTLLLYCASGMRSGMATRVLKAEGHEARNLGGFARWARAGLPTRKPTPQELR